MNADISARSNAAVPSRLVASSGEASLVPAIARTHVTSVDGLRGAACLAVVCNHCWLYSQPHSLPTISLGRLTITRALFFDKLTVGVDLFFVLSGFCLALPLFLKRGRPWNWKIYFARRCMRILPTFWICLTLFFVLHSMIERWTIAPFAGKILTVPSIRQLALTYGLVSSSLNESFWTLPVEWRWYFVLPILMGLWRRFGAKVAGLGCVAIAVTTYFLWTYGPGRLTFLLTPLPILLPMFGAGVWAADICSGRPLSKIEQLISRGA